MLQYEVTVYGTSAIHDVYMLHNTLHDVVCYVHAMMLRTCYDDNDWRFVKGYLESPNQVLIRDGFLSLSNMDSTSSAPASSFAPSSKL